MDTFSKSDPYVILYVQRNNKWAEYGRTETIMDNLNPNFSKTFIIEYFFECKQPLRFEVNDYDGKNSFDVECLLNIAYRILRNYLGYYCWRKRLIIST